MKSLLRQLFTWDPTVRFPSSRLPATNVSYRAAGLPHFSLCLSLSLSSLPDDVTLQQVSNTKRAVNATGESAATTLAQTVEVGFSHYFSLSLGWGEGTAQVWQRPPLTDSTPASSARPSAEAAGLERSVVRARVQSEEGLPTGRDAFRSGGGSEAMSPGPPRQPLLPLRQVFRVGCASRPFRSCSARA